jgi:hypothetical protein
VVIGVLLVPPVPFRGQAVVMVTHAILERVENGLGQQVDLQGRASWVTLEVTGAAIASANWLI